MPQVRFQPRRHRPKNTIRTAHPASALQAESRHPLPYSQYVTQFASKVEPHRAKGDLGFECPSRCFRRTRALNKNAPSRDAATPPPYVIFSRNFQYLTITPTFSYILNTKSHAPTLLSDNRASQTRPPRLRGLIFAPIVAPSARGCHLPPPSKNSTPVPAPPEREIQAPGIRAGINCQVGSS